MEALEIILHHDLEGEVLLPFLLDQALLYAQALFLTQSFHYFHCILYHSYLIIQNSLLLNFVDQPKVVMVAQVLTLQQLLVAFKIFAEFLKLPQVNIFGFFQNLHLKRKVSNKKYALKAFPIFPTHSSDESDELDAHFCPLDFKALVFAERDLFVHYAQQCHVLKDQWPHIQPNEKMIVFIVLQSYSIAKQKQLIGKSSIAEVNLRTLFKLILRTTEHQKIIEFIHWPTPREVVFSLLSFVHRLLDHGLFLLPQAVYIGSAAVTVIKLFHQFEISDVLLMHLLELAANGNLIFLRILQFLYSFESLGQEWQTD